MRLQKYTVGGSTFTFPTAQNEIRQQWTFPRDGVALAGAVGMYPGMGDEVAPQQLAVSVTLQFAWGQTVNGTALDSWSDMVAVIDLCCRRLLQGQGKLWAIREDDSVVWAWAKVAQLQRPSLAVRRRLVDLPVTFVIEDTWYDDALSGAWCFDEGYDFDVVDGGDYFDIFDLVLTGVSGSTLNVTNVGNAPARVMTISIATSSGSVVNPKLAVDLNGYWLQWTGTVGSDTLTIKPGEFSILHGTADAYSGLTIGTAQIDWLRFEVGTNVMTFTCAGGGTGVVTVMFYSPLWNA